MQINAYPDERWEKNKQTNKKSTGSIQTNY